MTGTTQKVDPDNHYSNQPPSFVLAGQSVKRKTQAKTLQTLLQPRSPNQTLDGRTPAEEILNYTVPNS
jgi:hypothetical protein